MADTPFAQLARLGEQLEATSKRTELAALLAEFLRVLASDEVPADPYQIDVRADAPPR